MATIAPLNQDALYGAFLEIIEQPAARSSQRLTVRRGRPEVHVELSVRPCPIPGARWVVVLDSDDLAITPFQRKADAERHYTDLVRDCENDYARHGEHAWTSTDVPRMPTLTAG